MLERGPGDRPGEADIYRHHAWFQKHADEEFKLKRLDLDIDRANWLVELAMEWQNITGTQISSELLNKLARSLFIPDASKDMDIHPAETVLSAILGNEGSVNVEFPTKFTIQRGKDGKSKGTNEKK